MAKYIHSYTNNEGQKIIELVAEDDILAPSDFPEKITKF